MNSVFNDGLSRRQVIQRAAVAASDQDEQFMRLALEEARLGDYPFGAVIVRDREVTWQVLGRQAAFDVLTEKKVERPIFSEPRTWEKTASVGDSATAVVNFVISAK